MSQTLMFFEDCIDRIMRGHSTILEVFDDEFVFEAMSEGSQGRFSDSVREMNDMAKDAKILVGELREISLRNNLEMVSFDCFVTRKKKMNSKIMIDISQN